MVSIAVVSRGTRPEKRDQRGYDGSRRGDNRRNDNCFGRTHPTLAGLSVDRRGLRHLLTQPYCTHSRHLPSAWKLDIRTFGLSGVQPGRGSARVVPATSRTCCEVRYRVMCPGVRDLRRWKRKHRRYLCPHQVREPAGVSRVQSTGIADDGAAAAGAVFYQADVPDLMRPGRGPDGAGAAAHRGRDAAGRVPGASPPGRRVSSGAGTCRVPQVAVPGMHKTCAGRRPR